MQTYTGFQIWPGHRTICLYVSQNVLMFHEAPGQFNIESIEETVTDTYEILENC